MFFLLSTSYGYSDIVTIPVGATNIDIKQRSHRGIKHDGNYLAVKRESGAYILNGNFSVSTVEQDIPVLGAVLKYSGSSTTLERIQSFSQLKEAITIQILATGVDNNTPKIKYTFFIPKDVTFNKSKEKKGLYLSLHVISDAPDWVSGEWSECSKSCGSGWSRRSIECRDGDGFVSSQCDKELKPTDIRPCGDLPCPIWQMGPWSACSRTCGQGERHRSVFCIDYTGKTDRLSVHSKVDSKMGVKTFTHSSTSHSQEMLDKLNALRNEGHLCDVTIRVQDKLFLAHKVVLACCSEFFRSKLVGRPEEEEKFVLDLHHVTVSGFAPLLEYAYTSTLSISTENIIDVLAAASYMQMFAVASTCSEFMKSSILWSSTNNNSNLAADKPHEAAPESASSNCALTPLDGSVSPVSSDCSVMERNVPICRESRRKRKSFVTMASPESPLKCTTQMVTTSPQIPNPSPSFSDGPAQPVESSLAFPWTFPFGIDRRFHSDKSKLPESPRCLEQGAPGTSEGVVARRLSDFLTCESSKVASSPVATEEEDVRVKVERLSDEEVQEASSQPVSASQSSMSDQQTVPGSEQVQEELLISPQSSSIGVTIVLRNSFKC
ncbi:hypothetical protein GOODEAATRI_008697 [Goodea atripinnis]|uniref:BTB domain-containing protein n=2 Tax=Goodeidae TaxID=28758 RepID=A0ABV0MSD2_9TELE